MKNGNNILISSSDFSGRNNDCFYVKLDNAIQLSEMEDRTLPYLKKMQNGVVVGILKGANQDDLKYAYHYICQSKQTGKWHFNIAFSDKELSNIQFVEKQEEYEKRVQDFNEKVGLLNDAQYKETELPIVDFVKEHISEIDSPHKFALLLTKLMKELFSENHFVTEKQLKYFSTPNTPKRYKTFQIRKKSGGLREINAPNDRLNKILQTINVVFKSLYTPHKSVCGFTEGKSIADNAARHTGQHYVFNIDLKDFFSSIPQARVWARLQLRPFNFPKEVANVVAGLCCVKNSETGKNILPQGAPTSPLLTNAVCDKLDRELYKLSKKYGLHYSRYADDITFSSMHNVYQEDSEFRKELKNIIEGQNFCLNDKKTRLLRSGQRQEVTGLTVNAKVNVARKYVRDLRCLLHIWETKGYGKAYSYFYPIYKKEKGYVKKGEPVMENVIGGKLNYLRMIKGAGNECYQKLLQRYDKLQQIIYVDDTTDKGSRYVYVQQYTLADFEKDFSTKISLQISAKKNLVGKCNIYGMDKTLPISHKTQEVLCPNFKQLDDGKTVKSEILKDCFVTLCRQKGKNFWLITQDELERSKCLSIQNAWIEPDKLLYDWEKYGFTITVRLFQLFLYKQLGSEKYTVEDIRNFLNMLYDYDKLRKKQKTIVDRVLEKEEFKYVSQKEIQEFVYFVTHHKQFNRKQKFQRDRLLTRDLAAKYIEKTETVIDDGKHRCGVLCEYVSPKKLQKFLFDFNQDEVLKYTCHPIDSEEVIEEINKQCKTDLYSVEEHSKLIIERFESKFKGEKQSKNMKGLIYAYLKGPKEWSSNRVVINWSSTELINWGNEHIGKVASPGKNIATKQKNNGFKLPNPFVSAINGKRVATFTNLVIFFKTLFHIRRDNSLKNIIIYNNKSIENANITFSSNFNENIELFTDVDKLLQAYKNIIKICTECSLEGEQPIIEISFYKEENNVYFCIHHINTRYGKTKDDSLKRIGESQSNLIKNQINGLCDLFIEADFGNKEYACINLWDESDELKSENISEMQGVKYILRF